MSAAFHALALSPSDGPRLLHPGRGVAWWSDGERLLWADEHRVWWRVGDQVHTRRSSPPDHVELGEVPVLWTGGRATPLDGGPTPLRRAALPDGGQDAASLRALPGGGRAWVEEGWLYRQGPGGLRPVATLASGERWTAGAAGALLLGGRRSWTRVAAPGRDARTLPEILPVTPWGVRWSPDGARLAAPDERGGSVVIEVASGRILRRDPGLPLSDALFLGEDGAVPGTPWRLLETSTARRHALLAGPGGVVWDLTAERPLFDAPVVHLGATVAGAGPWATVDWETGDGHWFDPTTGTPGDRFRLPLKRGDVVESGEPRGDGALFASVLGAWEVVGERVTRSDDLPEPDPDGEVPDDLAELFEASAVVGGRRFGWSTEGLLIALPDRA